jgi:hypothetical protein
MKRLLLPLLFAVVAVACQRTAAPTKFALAPQQAIRIPRAEVRDIIAVEVTGRSTIYVLQNGRVRGLVEWVHSGAGTVSIPLGAMDDGISEWVIVGALPGSIDELDPGHELSTKICSKCIAAPQFAGAPCCPGD